MQVEKGLLENELGEARSELANHDKALKESEAKNADLLETQNRLEAEISQLTEQLSQKTMESIETTETLVSTTHDLLSGNWRLRVNVEALASPSAIQKVNWIVDYDIRLNVDNGVISGEILKANDIIKDSFSAPSNGSGTIQGTVMNNEVIFTVGEKSKGAVSQYRLQLNEGTLSGRLEADNLVEGWNAYVGSVSGQRISSF